MLNKRLKKIILFFTVIITLTTTASYLLVKGYLYPLIITSVQKIIEEKTGQKASIEKLTLSFFPPELIINNFSIEGNENDPIEVQATKIAAKLNPLQAISGTITITNLDVNSPSIRLTANEEKITHLASLLKPKTELKPAFFKFDIKKINLKNGNIKATIEGEGAIELHNTNLNLNRNDKKSPIKLTVESGRISYKEIVEPFINLNVSGFLSQKKLNLHTISINSEKVSITGHSLIDFKKQTFITGQLGGKLPLSRIKKYLKNELDINGEINVRAQFVKNNNGWNIQSELSLKKGAVKELPLKNMNASLSFSRQNLKVKTNFLLAESNCNLKGNISFNSGLYTIEGKVKGMNIPWLKADKAQIGKDMRLLVKGKGNIEKPSFKGKISTITKGDTQQDEEKNEITLTVKGDLTVDGENIKLALSEDIFGRVQGKLSTDKGVDLVAAITSNKLQNISLLLGTELTGKATIRGKIGGDINNLSFSGHTDLQQFSVNGYPYKKITADVNYADKLLESDNMEIIGENSTIAVGGIFSHENEPSIDLALSIKNGNLTELMSMTKTVYPVKGNISGQFQIKGPIKAPILTAKMNMSDIKIKEEFIDSLFYEGELSKKRIEIKALKIRRGKGSLRVKGTIEPEKDVDLKVRISGINPEEFSFIKNKVGGLTGKINFRGKITGKSKAPKMKGRVNIFKLGWEEKKLLMDLSGHIDVKTNLDDINSSMVKLYVSHFEIAPEDYKLQSKAPFGVDYTDGELIVGKLMAKGSQSDIHLNGKISKNGNINFSISGETEVEGLQDRLEALENIAGKVTFNSTISGSLEKPQVNASIKAENGMVRFSGFPYDMTQIRGTLTLKQNELTIDEAEGILQEAKFTGGGGVIFKDFQISSTDLYFDLEEMSLRFPSWLSSKGHGRITVAAKEKNITLGGDIKISRAIYSENFDLKEMMKKKSGESKTEKKDEGENGLNFNFHFSADDNLIIKNDLTNVEMKGFLNLVGNREKLSLLGEIEAIGGKIYFRNKEFSIVRGGVNFSDTEKINPFFEIDAETEVKEYFVHLNVSGHTDNFSVHLSSNPPLEEKEVVSLLVLGYTGNELQASETEMTSLEAVSLLLQGELEGKVKKYFGIDRFQIEPFYSQYSGSTEARVTIGKELREDLMATYSRDISGSQKEQLNLEYRLDDNLSLMGSWSSQEEQVGTFGGDVILRLEFQ